MKKLILALVIVVSVVGMASAYGHGGGHHGGDVHPNRHYWCTVDHGWQKGR